MGHICSVWKMQRYNTVQVDVKAEGARLGLLALVCWNHTAGVCLLIWREMHKAFWYWDQKASYDVTADPFSSRCPLSDWK